ncbi:MAG: glycoside hydrolase family 65 protein [Elusimicrobia bacterium]|nr:glycoside hydrolase family 65 protein [Elusimicrobiota bacterium]
MRNYFDDYLSGAQWLVVQRGWNPEKQLINESLFSLGNGYITSRGILEEIPFAATPGTFFAGVYDKVGAMVTELVNTPNPIDFRISVKGEKLDVSAMNVIDHKRILDLYRGILVRRTVYSDAKKKRFDYQSIRFISQADKHVAVMKIYVTPLDDAAEFSVESNISIAITNKGLITEGRKKHFHISDVSKADTVNYLCAKTLEKNILISYASQLKIKKGKKSYCEPHRMFKISAKKNETVCFTKFFSFYTSRETDAKVIKSKAIQTVKKTVDLGFEKLLSKHCASFAEKWKSAVIEIEGDPSIERAVRFNIYHLFICANEDDDNISIGARTLTGEGYRGHVFWDTEIFILPFFIYTNPKIARNLLMYRYHRLDMARKIAENKGYKGAMFPWESADTGEETTPSWSKGLDGRIKKISTMEQEQHIGSDIAYSIFHYFVATGDLDFMLNYGLEIILETARFWESRVEYNKRKKRYEIRNVIGPDEFHESVNNNAYTNVMVQWHLRKAVSLYKTFEKSHRIEIKKLDKKIDIKQNEMKNWMEIAKKIYVPVSKKANIIEEFDGFFKKKYIPLPELDSNSLPVFPRDLKVTDIIKTQFVKQADVVLLMYLLSDNFNLKWKEKNYIYYEKRTLHKSSLSASVYCIGGVEVGERNKAYKYFLVSAYTDKKNIYGNTGDGMHAAALGGVWQAVVNGFAGIRIKKGVLSLEPRLPNRWKRVKFSIKWKGFDICVNIDKEKIKLYFRSKNKINYLPVRIYGVLKKLSANRTRVFYRKLKRRREYIVKKALY